MKAINLFCFDPPCLLVPLTKIVRAIPSGSYLLSYDNDQGHKQLSLTEGLYKFCGFEWYGWWFTDTTLSWLEEQHLCLHNDWRASFSYFASHYSLNWGQICGLSPALLISFLSCFYGFISLSFPCPRILSSWELDAPLAFTHTWQCNWDIFPFSAWEYPASHSGYGPPWVGKSFFFFTASSARQASPNFVVESGKSLY